MTVEIAGQQLPVLVFKLQHTEASGHPRTFYLVQVRVVWFSFFYEFVSIWATGGLSARAWHPHAP
jgi:hypothetical protein